MEITVKSSLKFINWDLGKNKIGAKGCQYLSDGKLIKLTKIDLGIDALFDR